MIAFLPLDLTLSSSTVADLSRGSNLLKLPSFCESLATAKECSDLARVNPVHHHHRNPHHQRVEDIEEDLVDHDESIVALGVFDHSDDRPHEDQDADEVKREHVLPPGCGVALAGRLLMEARVEDCGCDDEEAEDDDLHDETADDDVGSHVAVVGAVGGGEESGA